MNFITNFIKRIFNNSEQFASLDGYQQYRIDFVCPNSGEWKTLHCIYRLRPIVNREVKKDIEIWIALPNEEEIWNFMTFHSNNKSDFELPFEPSEFVKKHIFYRPANKEIDLYVYYSLI